LSLVFNSALVISASKFFTVAVLILVIVRH